MDLNFVANANGIVDGVGLGGDNTTYFATTNYMFGGPYYGASTLLVRAQRAYGAGTTGRTAYNCVAQYAVLPA